MNIFTYRIVSGFVALVMLGTSIVNTMNAQSLQWQSVGPNGINFSSTSKMTVHNEHIYYMQKTGTLFESFDNGKSWKHLHHPFAQHFLTNIALTDTNTIYVSTGETNSVQYVPALMSRGIIFRSRNRGQDWDSISFPTSLRASSIRLTATNKMLFAYSENFNEGLFRWNDNTQLWQTIPNIIRGEKITGLASVPPFLFANAGGVLYRSQDEGQTWSVFATNIDYLSGARIGRYVFLGTSTGLVRVDTLTLQATPIPVPTRNQRIRNIAATNRCLIVNNTLFESEIVCSCDTGRTWQPIGGLSRIYGTIFASAETFFSVSDPTLQRSDNNGQTWVQSDSGLTGGYVSMFSLVQNRLFAHTSAGIFSTDTAFIHRTWTNHAQIPDLQTRIVSLGQSLYAITRDTSDTIYSFAVICSRDSGRSWETVRRKIAIAYLPSTLFLTRAASVLLTASGDTVLRSADSGKTWQRVFQSYLTGLSPIVCWNGRYILYNNRAGLGIYRSDDTGKTWNIVRATGFSANAGSITNIIADGRILYAITSNGIFNNRDEYLVTNSNIFRSTDDGITWIPAREGIDKNDIGSLTARNNIVIAAVNNPNYLFSGGILLSTDTGRTWRTANTGLQNYDIQDLHIVGNFIYAATFGGSVLRAPLPLTTDVRMSFEPVAPGNVPLSGELMLFPNPTANTSTLRYTLTAPVRVRIDLTDSEGRTIALLRDMVQPAGEHDVPVSTARLAAGVYFVRLTARSASGENMHKTVQFHLMR
jgi:photosystem II stability/assembly factor-like uncharacterized protein